MQRASKFIVRLADSQIHSLPPGVTLYRQQMALFHHGYIVFHSTSDEDFSVSLGRLCLENPCGVTRTQTVATTEPNNYPTP